MFIKRHTLPDLFCVLYPLFITRYYSSKVLDDIHRRIEKRLRRESYRVVISFNFNYRQELWFSISSYWTLSPHDFCHYLLENFQWPPKKLFCPSTKPFKYHNPYRVFRETRKIDPSARLWHQCVQSAVRLLRTPYPALFFGFLKPIEVHYVFYNLFRLWLNRFRGRRQWRGSLSDPQN